MNKLKCMLSGKFSDQILEDWVRLCEVIPPKENRLEMEFLTPISEESHQDLMLIAASFYTLSRDGTPLDATTGTIELKIIDVKTVKPLETWKLEGVSMESISFGDEKTIFATWRFESISKID